MMTKGNMSLQHNDMKFDTVTPILQIQVEDVISPCKEKMQQILRCCQDVSRRLDSIQSHIEFNRPQETKMPKDDSCKDQEVHLLQEKLHKSIIRIEQLQVKEALMRKKITEMDEKVQTLTAQLMVYREDFDLERKDRERAQGRIVELEQMLLKYQRAYAHDPTESRIPHFSGSHCCHSIELVARGQDVCDIYQTDGATRFNVEKNDHKDSNDSVDAIEKDDYITNQLLPISTPDICSSVELQARSFDFHDFFPDIVSVDSTVIRKEQLLKRYVVVDDGKKAANGELCADGIAAPTVQVYTSAEPLQETKFTHSFSHLQPETKFNHSATHLWSDTSLSCDDLVNHEKLHPKFHITTSGSGVLKDELSFYNLNLDERCPSNSLLHDNKVENSTLKCPKCFTSFSLKNHIDFLDHLEEC